ncbi:hypothetical protein HK107_14085 [Parvularcula sp. ZS-1/3]|uniref:Uncharacterized protein n=1 Tax=Parvularcula mediterranea TaxID=2732508 RepID=A0A7Y3RNR5_9PROT|nr:hypothetical protein [Parvularcula mediterranea]NNU17458.1 hypothetical protein [Parvularcula mediterranea]
MRFEQAKKGNRVEIELGEASFRYKSKIEGEASDLRIEYADIPFDKSLLTDPAPVAWVSWLVAIMGAVFAVGSVFAIFSGDEVRADNGQSNLIVALIMLAIGAGRILWLRRKILTLHVFHGPLIRFTFLDDEKADEIIRTLEARRNEVVRRKHFVRHPEDSDEHWKANLAWLVDRDVITREEYDTALADLEKPAARVGFATERPDPSEG